MTKSDCPGKEKLVDYLLGKLPVELSTNLETHFQDCDACEETIRGLSATDTLTKLVSKADKSAKLSTQNDEQFVAGLIERIQQDTAKLNSVDSGIVQRAAEVIGMLGPGEDAESLGQLAHYRVDELIGAGSTGVVFKAIDEHLNRAVALKVLRPSLGKSARQRFVSEARAAASVNNPNVVTIYQVDESNELAFIAMKWVPGETLEDRLQHLTFVSEAELKTIALQVASGLQAAHERNLIHRDIKPANIWLSSVDNQAIILDFGLARIADDDPQLTSTGMLAGTPNFMSPEQSKGQELDGRSDLFSLGCVLYRASTGKLPFGANGILATLQAIQKHCPAPPIRVNPAISANFSDLVMCLLDKQPANRPASAEHFANALKTPRKKWKFAVPKTQLTPNSQENLLQSSHPKTNSNWYRWAASILAIGMLAIGWSMFGQQIIRVVTDHGELIIETEENDVQVEVLSGGQVVQVVNTWAEQKIDLKSGEYQIRPKNKSDASLRYEMSDSEFVLKRGSKQMVSIKLANLSNDAAPSVAASKTDSKIEPMYEGKSYAVWLDLLKREKSMTIVKSAIRALGSLSSDDSELQDEVISALRPFVRKFGSGSNYSKPTEFPVIFTNFFGQMSPEKVVDFIVKELERGNWRSRTQMERFLVGGFSRRSSDSRLAETIRSRLSQITNAAIVAWSSDSTSMEKGYVRNLLSNSILAGFNTDFLKSNTKNELDGYKSLLTKKIANEKSKEISAYLAIELFQLDPESETAAASICRKLVDSELSEKLTGELYSRHLQRVPDAMFKFAIQPLIEIYEDENLLARIPDTRGLGGRGAGGLAGRASNGSIGIGGGPGKTFGDNEGSQKQKQKTDQITSANNRRRTDILNKMGYRKSFASNALPWLDKIAAGDSAQQEPAANAANYIRGLPNEFASATAMTILSEPLYHGSTFEQWVTRLSRERSKETVFTGLRGLAELSRNDPEKQARAIASVRPFVRLNGGIVIQDADSWVEAFNQFFSSMPAKDVIDFAIEEIKNGTTSSQKQSIWFLMVGSIYEGNSGAQDLHRRTIANRLHDIVDAGCSQIETNKTKESRSIRDLMSVAIRTSFSKWVPATNGKFGQQKMMGISDESAKYFSKKLASTDNKTNKAFLVEQLVQWTNTTPELVAEFAISLGDHSLPPDLDCKFYFNCLPKIKDRHFPLIVPTLINFLKVDERCKRLSDCQNDIFDGRDVKFQSLLGIQNNLSEIDQVKADVIYRLAKRGRFAKPALEYLDLVAANNSILKKHARKAGAMIRGGNSPLFDKPASTISKQAKVSSSNAQPTFEGRTFDSWMEILENDRDESTVNSGLNAIGALSSGIPEKEKLAIALVRRMMQQRGGNIIDSLRNGKRIDIVSSITQFFGHLPVETTVDFAINELRDGNLKSQKQVFFLLADSGVYTEDVVTGESKHERHKNVLRSRASEIIKRLNEILRSKLEKEEIENARNLLTPFLNLAFTNPTMLNQIEFQLPKKTVEQLLRIVINTKDKKLESSLLLTLARAGAPSKMAQSKLLAKLGKGEISLFYVTQFYGSAISGKFKDTSGVVEPLIAIYKNDEYCESLAKHKNDGRGFLTAANAPVVEDNDIRSEIVSRLVSFGLAAEPALPFLDEIAAGETALKKAAAEAAKSIRSQLPENSK